MRDGQALAVDAVQEGLGEGADDRRHRRARSRRGGRTRRGRRRGPRPCRVPAAHAVDAARADAATSSQERDRPSALALLGRATSRTLTAPMSRRRPSSRAPSRAAGRGPAAAAGHGSRAAARGRFAARVRAGATLRARTMSGRRDRQPDADLHAARRRRRDPPGRHEPGARRRTRASRPTATVDELNALARGGAGRRRAARRATPTWLRRVQNDLFDVGADLAVPARAASASGCAWRPSRWRGWRRACDEVNATLAPLKSFVLPGGTLAAAHLHVCRTVCRRAERRALRGRGRQPRGRALPQPALGPALHPQPRRQRGRRAAVGAGGFRSRHRPPAAPADRIRALDAGAMAAARERQAQLVKPPGSLGRLEELAVWLAGVTGAARPAMRARVVVAAADHGVAAEGVSAYPRRGDGADAARRSRRAAAAVSRARRARRAPTSCSSTPASAGGSDVVDVRARRPRPQPRPRRSSRR